MCVSKFVIFFASQDQWTHIHYRSRLFSFSRILVIPVIEWLRVNAHVLGCQKTLRCGHKNLGSLEGLICLTLLCLARSPNLHIQTQNFKNILISYKTYDESLIIYPRGLLVSQIEKTAEVSKIKNWDATL